MPSDLEARAAAIVESRNEDYGDPRENWTRIAAYMTATLGAKLTEPITASEAVLLMCDVKRSRLCVRYKTDSVEDFAAYAKMAEDLR